MKTRSRVAGAFISLVLAGSLLPVAAQATTVGVAPSAEKVVASEYVSASFRSVNKCNTTRKTYLVSGYTTAPANTKSYNDCWLSFDVDNYSFATKNLQKNGLAFSDKDADGFYGDKTRTAVKNRQISNSVYPDGEYGWNTGKAITWKNQNGHWYKWS